MLALEASGRSLQRSIIDFAVSHVIRHEKRWGRYEMNLTKDLKRIKVLLKRSAGEAILQTEKYGAASPAQTSGWIGQKETDLVAFYGNDFLEVVAIMEYWGLWQYLAKELPALMPSK